MPELEVLFFLSIEENMVAERRTSLHCTISPAGSTVRKSMLNNIALRSAYALAISHRLKKSTMDVINSYQFHYFPKKSVDYQLCYPSCNEQWMPLEAICIYIYKFPGTLEDLEAFSHWTCWSWPRSGEEDLRVKAKSKALPRGSVASLKQWVGEVKVR